MLGVIELAVAGLGVASNESSLSIVVISSEVVVSRVACNDGVLDVGGLGGDAIEPSSEELGWGLWVLGIISELLRWSLLDEDEIVSSSKHSRVEEDTSVPGVELIADIVVNDLLVVLVDLGGDLIPILDLSKCVALSSPLAEWVGDLFVALGKSVIVVLLSVVELFVTSVGIIVLECFHGGIVVSGEVVVWRVAVDNLVLEAVLLS